MGRLVVRWVVMGGLGFVPEKADSLGSSHICYHSDGVKETNPYDATVGYLIMPSPLNRSEVVGFGL